MSSLPVSTVQLGPRGSRGGTSDGENGRAYVVAFHSSLLGTIAVIHGAIMLFKKKENRTSQPTIIRIRAERVVW
jgi:hypothetical protein